MQFNYNIVIFLRFCGCLGFMNLFEVSVLEMSTNSLQILTINLYSFSDFLLELWIDLRPLSFVSLSSFIFIYCFCVVLSDVFSLWSLYPSVSSHDLWFLTRRWTFCFGTLSVRVLGPRMKVDFFRENLPLLILES